jgi:DNA-binding NtrC family response regulator
MSTILVVDDCGDTSDLYSLVLMSRGHVVLVATSVQKAVEMAYTHKGKIDLLLTDLFLGDGMGCELPHLLGKRMPKASILITGRDPRPGARYQGFDDYLLKPADPDEMVRTVESCIKLHQEEEAVV